LDHLSGGWTAAISASASMEPAIFHFKLHLRGPSAVKTGINQNTLNRFSLLLWPGSEFFGDSLMGDGRWTMGRHTPHG